MNKPMIRLTSVTYAVRGQKLLDRHGIHTNVRKISNQLDTRGCGYALEISGDPYMAAELLTNAGIQIVEIIV